MTTLLGTTLFVLGFSLVFATEGLAFGGLGLVLVRHQEGVTQVLGAVTIVLHQVIRHALRGFGPDTGEHAQRFDEHRFQETLQDRVAPRPLGRVLVHDQIDNSCKTARIELRRANMNLLGHQFE